MTTEIQENKATGAYRYWADMLRTLGYEVEVLSAIHVEQDGVSHELSLNEAAKLARYDTDHPLMLADYGRSDGDRTAYDFTQQRRLKTDVVVELESGVWLARWKEGDPPRTLVRLSAKRFESIGAANAAVDKAREFRPYKNARVYSVWRFAQNGEEI